jgi:protein TonB
MAMKPIGFEVNGFPEFLRSEAACRRAIERGLLTASMWVIAYGENNERKHMLASEHPLLRQLLGLDDTVKPAPEPKGEPAPPVADARPPAVTVSVPTRSPRRTGSSESDQPAPAKPAPPPPPAKAPLSPASPTTKLAQAEEKAAQPSKKIGWLGWVIATVVGLWFIGLMVGDEPPKEADPVATGPRDDTLVQPAASPSEGTLAPDVEASREDKPVQELEASSEEAQPRQAPEQRELVQREVSASTPPTDVANEPSDVSPPQVRPLPSSAPIPATPRGRYNFFSDDDYPIASRAASEEGATRVRYLIGRDGLVSQCVVVQSSGFARLDNATCEIILRRFRFNPASSDANGQLVREQKTQTVTWRLNRSSTGPGNATTIANTFTGTIPAARISSTNFFTDDDYPSVSRAAEEEGVTRVSYVVGTDGRVSECEVVQSSGFKRLDDATCSIIERRFRFNPAIRDGQPVPERKIQPVRWRLPS